jgi:DNA-binding NarL/FixJ family response regulator
MNEQNVKVTGRAGAGSAPGSPEPSASGFHVLVVDPDPNRRRNLAVRLKVMGAEAVTESTATHSVHAAERCDLVVLHTSQTPRSTAELLGDLRRQGRKRVVVVASAHDPVPAIAAFTANAVGYLVGRSDPAPVDGFATWPPTGDERLIRDEYEHVRILSAREIEILSLLAEGKSNREIGADLTLSVNTVKGHLAQLAKKLQTGDRSRMVLLALRSGVIS